MKDRIIFLNTGWMDFYKGISNDKITGGGKHVVSQGWGGEVFNFREFNGSMYGYVQPKIDRKYNNPCTIKLEKIGASESDEKLTGVTVVWTASDPMSGGTYIVGWYLNATVYRFEQPPPKNSKRNHKNIPIGFYAFAKSNNTRLLPVDERVIKIKRQQKNWMGQSNVWYADENPQFVKLVRDYIVSGNLPSYTQQRTALTKPRQNDILKRIAVETSAVKLVTAHYFKLGYEVKSVEKDNVGWDLIASNNKIELKLEVKGLSGNSLIAELTPNEFKNLKAHKTFYRICIVTDALGKKPILTIFYFSNEIMEWISDDGRTLKFEEVISARVFV